MRKFFLAALIATSTLVYGCGSSPSASSGGTAAGHWPAGDPHAF